MIEKNTDQHYYLSASHRELKDGKLSAYSVMGRHAGGSDIYRRAKQITVPRLFSAMLLFLSRPRSREVRVPTS